MKNITKNFSFSPKFQKVDESVLSDFLKGIKPPNNKPQKNLISNFLC